MSSIPQPPPSHKHIGIIAGISIACIVIGIAGALIFEFVIKPKLLCTDKGALVLCKNLKNQFPTKNPTKGSSCYRVVDTKDYPDDDKDPFALHLKYLQNRPGQFKDADKANLRILRASYPAEIVVKGYLIAKENTPVTKGRNVFRLKDNEIVTISDDFSSLEILTPASDKKSMTTVSRGFPTDDKQQKLVWDLSDPSVTFDGLAFKDYILRVKETCPKAMVDSLDANMKALYGDDYRSELIAKLGKDKFVNMYPILNSRCYTGMGLVPSGRWMCTESECMGLKNQPNKVVTVDSKTGKKCILLDEDVYRDSTGAPIVAFPPPLPPDN